METTPSIVTTKKENDSRRVEAGKRLAAISKQAKKGKRKRESAALSRGEMERDSWAISSPPGGLMLTLTTAGVVVALATLWYTRKDYQLSIKESRGGSSRGADEDPKETSNSDEEGGSLGF